jgi:redox-sensitive bicupin YhaK (pirin superfamily)
VISGEVFGVKGPIEANTPTYYLDFYMKEGSSYTHEIPKGWNSMILVHKGSFLINDSLSLKFGDCAAFALSDT